MRKLRYYGLCVILTLTSAVAHAQQAHAAADSSTPDIFSGGEFGMSIFTLLIFTALFLILRKWAWGPLLDGLRRREGHIRQSVEETELAREEAFLSLRQYEARLAQAQDEAQQIMEEARGQALRMTDEIKQRAEEEIKTLRHRAEQEMAMLREQALRVVSDQAAELTTELAGRIMKRQLNPDDHRGLIQESLENMSKRTN